MIKLIVTNYFGCVYRRFSHVYFSGVTGMVKSRTSLDASAVAVPGVIGVRTDCVQSQPGNKFILAINYTEKHFL